MSTLERFLQIRVSIMALVTSISVDLPMKRKCVSETTNGNDDTDITTLKVKKLSDSAKIPTRESADAAGYDLYR